MEVSNLISGIIGVIVGSIISVTGAWIIQWQTIQSDRKNKHLEKLEEISLLIAQVDEWMNDEAYKWYLVYEHFVSIEDHKNPFECPIHTIQALSAVNEPSLSDMLSHMRKKVSQMKTIALDLSEQGIEITNSEGYEAMRKVLEEYETYSSKVKSLISSKTETPRKNRSKAVGFNPSKA